MERALLTKIYPPILHGRHSPVLGSPSLPIHPYPIHLSRSLHARLADSWKQMNAISHSKTKVVCLFGNKGGNDKEAAIRALQSALGGKKDAFNRWDEEIKKREEAAGGRGGNSGRGWFGGGGWFGGFGNEDSWKEIQQAIYAVGGLVLMYLLLVKGEAMISVVLNAMVFLLRGPRDVYRSITTGEFKMEPAPNSGDESSLKGVDATAGSAQADVIRKSGRDIISVVLNSIVLLLRGPRDVFRSITTGKFKMAPAPNSGDESRLKGVNARPGSAQANVIRKWGRD